MPEVVLTTEEEEPQTVVIGVDFRDESERAVKFYIEKFHRTGNRVILLHCIDLPKKIPEEKADVEEEGRDVSRELWEEEESNLNVLESKLTFLFMSHQIAATMHSVLGKPTAMIWRVADAEGASLIVLGSRRAHGKKSAFRSVIGSMAGLDDGVTEAVLKYCSCPVAVCRAPQDERRFSLFSPDRRFSFMPAQSSRRQRTQSTSAVEVAPKAHKKHRHSSGGESIASRIKRRFSSGHRLMSLSSVPPGLELGGKLDEAGDEDDCAFEHHPGEGEGARGGVKEHPHKSAKKEKLAGTRGQVSFNLTVEATVESGSGPSLEDVEDEGEEGEGACGADQCAIRMKNLHTSHVVAAPTKA